MIYRVGEMTDLFNLNGMCAAVTGGYGHLGEAMCRALASYGANVYVLARSEEKFHGTFSDNPKGIHFLSCDISSTPSVQNSVREIQQECGRLDILVNNANYAETDQPLNLSDDAWAYTVDGVLGSVYRCIREVAPVMSQIGRGSIINIGTMYGEVSPDFELYSDHPEMTNPPHYGAAKAGVIQLTRYFAQLLGRDGIRVNAISPGPFPSPVVQQKQEFVKKLEQKTAMDRIGQPEDLAGAVVFFASESSGYVTGQNLVVDGGWTAAR